MPGESTPRLFPTQVCFVVDDVRATVADCTARFGWGPFEVFTAPVDDVEYRGWRGRRVTDVGLGMAGDVQVELIHTHEGHGPVEAYQARYGTGLQHLGVGCRSREETLGFLLSLGGGENERMEHDGIEIAFVDTPTGPAVFELLAANPDAPRQESDERGPRPEGDVVRIDRATVVTDDMDEALAFYAAAFRWADARAERCALRCDAGEFEMLRYRGRAGTLEIELVSPVRPGSDPYSAHLDRGDHGLAHAGAAPTARGVEGPAVECTWLDTEEAFALHDWGGGARTLAIRAA